MEVQKKGIISPDLQPSDFIKKLDIVITLWLFNSVQIDSIGIILGDLLYFFK